MKTTKPIIFFDGVCNLCNGFIAFLMRRSRLNAETRPFSIASLQGETAKASLPQMQSMESIIWLEPEGKVLKRSDAFLAIMQSLGGIWTLFGVLRIVPRAWRDMVYDRVAKNRYSWFGKKDYCRLPTPEEKTFFLP